MNSARPRRLPGCRSPAPAATSADSRSPISSSRACPPTSTPSSAQAVHRKASKRINRLVSCATQQPNADFLGIAIHCAQNSPLCNKSYGKDDLLPTSRADTLASRRCSATYHVQPVISPSGPVKDLDGNVIQTAAGHPGFPNTLQPAGNTIAGLCRDDARGGRPGRLSLHRRCARQPVPVPEHSDPAKPATSLSSSNTIPRSANSLPGLRRTASPRTTRCSSSCRTRTIISSAAPRARRIATASTSPAPTRRARRARSMRRSTAC